MRAIVGEDHARPALPADAVDGVAPAFVVAPGSVEEVSAALGLAQRAGLAVVPRGGGSKLAWGAPPQRADLVLSTARLDRVVDHAAGDLVVRAQAGVPLEALQRQLLPARQWLALDPPELGATLGGIVAAAASGPRRHRYGAPRDLLIGITVALADGSVAKAGGRVVKNVAGYDLCKLFAGSLGSLGVIVEATFRLHPRAETRRLVQVDLASPAAAGAAVQALLHTALVPSAIELRWAAGPGAPGRLAVLFESVPTGASAQAQEALRILAGHGDAQLAEDAALEEQWSALTEPLPGPRLKLSSLPARLPEVIDAVSGAAGRGLTHRLAGRAGLGVLYASFAGGGDRDHAAAVAELRRRLGPGTSVVVQQAAPGLKQRLDVWGDAGDALPLMRRVKQRFDPQGTLSPGRLAGGI